jgi:hypothetical protein
MKGHGLFPALIQRMLVCPFLTKGMEGLVVGQGADSANGIGVRNRIPEGGVGFSDPDIHQVEGNLVLQGEASSLGKGI